MPPPPPSFPSNGAVQSPGGTHLNRPPVTLPSLSFPDDLRRLLAAAIARRHYTVVICGQKNKTPDVEDQMDTRITCNHLRGEGERNPLTCLAGALRRLRFKISLCCAHSAERQVMMLECSRRRDQRC